MHPSQQLANVAPLPAPCDSSCSLSPSEELFDAALNAIVFNVQEEFLYHGDDIIMQRNDVTAICSNLEEQWVMGAMPDCMCTDNYWHDHAFAHVGNDNAEDECSLDLWAKFVEVTSRSQSLNEDASSSACRSMSPAYFSSETSGTNLVDMNTPFVQPSPGYSEASSFAAYQHDSHAPYIYNHVNAHLAHCNSTNSLCTPFSPSFLSGDTSGTYLANTDCSFIHPSPAYSEVSSFAAANQHDPLYMSDHTNDHLNMQMGIHCNETNSVYTSILPNLVHGNVAMTYSGSPTSNIATSDDDCFENKAFVSPPPHEPAGANWCALNLEARASRPQLNLEAGASPLDEASSYSMNTAGAIRNPSDCEAKTSEEVVRFLVESSTPAIDDGYAWRKYGQKNIKDRAHPRGYFRCAQPNCPVKKQTESSSDTQGFVLITYFGRHNH